MDFFESKKAILEYCGKDSKDVRWLDRAIKDGRIGICDGAYYVVEEYIKKLEIENGELEEEVVRLRKEKSEPKQSECPIQGEDDKLQMDLLKEQLHEATVNMDYYKKLAHEQNQLSKKIMEACYRLLKSKLGNKFTQTYDEYKSGIKEYIDNMEE